MTTIKASCPLCGDVSLTPRDVRVVACTRAEWSYYAFTCPGCQDEVSKPADEEIVTLLVSGGVSVEHWIIPAEALEPHDGAAVTYDELLDFALWLNSTDLVVAELVGPSPRG
jgi:hypothetical protein